MDGQGYAGGGQNATKPPELVAGLERLKRMANSLADLGDQLHQQANRLFGPEPPPPPTGTSTSVAPATGDGAPLLHQLAGVFETIERNMARASVAANRLSPLG